MDIKSSIRWDLILFSLYGVFSTKGDTFPHRHCCVVASRKCYQSARMPWLPPTLDVDDQLSSTMPQDCCAQSDPGHKFNAQRKSFATKYISHACVLCH